MQHNRCLHLEVHKNDCKLIYKTLNTFKDFNKKKFAF